MRNSLRRQLALWLGGIVVALALAGAAAAFRIALDEAHELQDDLLRQIAGLFDPTHLPPVRAIDAPVASYSDEAARIEVGLLPRTADAGSAWLPSSLTDGLHTLRLHDEGYRVYVRTLGDGQRVAVAQETAVRDEIARDSALLTLLPFVVLAPALIVLLTLILRRSFAPVEALSAEIEQRSEQQLHPVDETGVPAEVRPFVRAINRLLQRVERALSAERRFVAQAAHELRTPLTAISLQAERLERIDMGPEAAARLGALRQGIERSRALLEQLLALARAQAGSLQTRGNVLLEPVLRQVLEESMPLAMAKAVEIEALGDMQIPVSASEAELAPLLRNVVDNAVRYTAHGSRVCIRSARVGARLQIDVEDDGPGIALPERERVFEAFYRIPGSGESGSGLGLNIARTIANHLGGTIELGDREDGGRGLRVTVRLPAACQR